MLIIILWATHNKEIVDMFENLNPKPLLPTRVARLEELLLGKTTYSLQPVTDKKLYLIIVVLFNFILNIYVSLINS